jgi:hypothetical protein
MKKRFLTSITPVVILSIGFAALAITGCVSVPQPAPVSMPNKNDKPLTAGQNWLQDNKTAPTAKLTVSSMSGAYIELLRVSGATLPKATTGTQWSPVDVPAGREIELAVQYTANDYTSEADFTYPALTAGHTYVLTLDEPFLKKGKMRVINRRYWVNRGMGVMLSILFWELLLVGVPDALAEMVQPATIKSDAPKEGPSVLLYERTDNGKRKNKISLKLIYQYSLFEKQGFPVP